MPVVEVVPQVHSSSASLPKKKGPSRLFSLLSSPPNLGPIPEIPNPEEPSDQPKALSHQDSVAESSNAGASRYSISSKATSKRRAAAGNQNN